MKLSIIIVTLLLSSLGFAQEIETDCLAINGNKDKIIKTASVKTKIKSGATAQ